MHTIILPEPEWIEGEHGAHAVVRHFKLVAYPPSTQFPLAQYEVWMLGHRLQCREIEGDIHAAKKGAILAWHHECGADVDLPDNRDE